MKLSRRKLLAWLGLAPVAASLPIPMDIPGWDKITPLPCVWVNLSRQFYGPPHAHLLVQWSEQQDFTSWSVDAGS